MTDQKTLQPTSDVNYQYPLEEETSFIDILAVVVKKKGLIFLFTSIFTLLTICYYYLATPKYVATISFLPPFQEIYLSSIDTNLFTQTIGSSLDGENNENKNPESSARILNKLTSNKFLYHQFLTRVQSFNQQKKVFSEKNILENFFGNSLDPENRNQRFIDLHNTISLKMDVPRKSTKKVFLLDKPSVLEMTGSNPVAMAEFLNALTDSTKTAIIKETQLALQTTINNRLKLAQKHKEQIRLKANKDRLIKIQFFSDSLKIAKDLKIKNNNFNLLVDNEGLIPLTLETKNDAFKSFDKWLLIPQWFLFGENALKEEIKALNSRINDDSYIEGLVDLESKIKQFQSFEASTLTPRVVLVEQPSIPPTKPINLKVEKIFPIGIGLGLFFGIIAAFLSHSMGKLKNKNTIS